MPDPDRTAAWAEAGRERWLTAGEIARIFHVGPKTIARWAKEGRLPFMWTLGHRGGQYGHRRYPEAEIRALAETLKEP